MTKPPPYVPIAVLIAVALGVSTTNVPQEPGAVTKDHEKAMTASQIATKKLYSRDCAMCHGDNGHGLTDVKTLADKQDEELFTLIRNGKDKMPPEAEDRAKDDEIRNLIQYVRSFSKSETSASNSRN